MYHPLCGGHQNNRKELLKQLQELQKGKAILQHSSTFSTSQKRSNVQLHIQLQLVSQNNNVHVKAITHNTSSDTTYIKTLNVSHYTHFFIVFHNYSMQIPAPTCNSVWLFLSILTIIILPFKAK